MNEDKKIGIITLYGLYNHGNRLQNIAIQKMLEDRGYTVETIVCRKSRLKEFARTGINYFYSILGKPAAIRYVNFYKFVKKNTHIRFIYNKTGMIPHSLSEEYDYFIVGSDQVWNPEIRKNERGNFFLRFADRDQRICLSPSIAVNELDEQYKREYIQGLNGFRYLSSREESGARIIENVVGRKAEVLVDPSMMLTKEDWYKYCNPIKLPDEKYVLQLFLEPVDEHRKEKIRSIADGLGAVVIDMGSPDSWFYYSVAPDGFLQLIDHATMVCTDSFHAVAFSINFNTPFYVFTRVSKKESSNKMYSRIATILAKFSLEDRTEENYVLNDMTECNFSVANKILENERISFERYLDKCLGQKTKINISNLNENQCTGCLACRSACPQKCIQVARDAEGFYIPVVDEEKCSKCGYCSTICPVMSKATSKLTEKNLEEKPLEAWVGYSNDPDKIENSSSGGVFFHLASEIIDRGGIVFGAAFDNNMAVHHIGVETKDDIIRLQGSKYVQSFVGDSYIRAEEALKLGRDVLFVGTPCQIAGLKSFIRKDYAHLYLCDFVCHGVPSPEIWGDFINENFDGGISSINMRDKSKGWNNYSTRVTYEGGNSVVQDRKSSPYNKAFECNLTIRKSCFECSFKGVARISDITLADFWGIEKFYPELMNKRGTSLILVQSERGQELLKCIKESVNLTGVDISKIVGKSNTAMIKSPAMNPYRSELFRHMDQPITGYLNNTADKCINRNNGLSSKINRKVRRVLNIK